MPTTIEKKSDTCTCPRYCPEHQCAERVFSGARHDFGGHSCPNKAKVIEDDGKRFCHMHTYAKKDQRKQEADERYAAYRNKLDAQIERDRRGNGMVRMGITPEQVQRLIDACLQHMATSTCETAMAEQVLAEMGYWPPKKEDG
jgi:hypothetical protein